MQACESLTPGGGGHTHAVAQEYGFTIIGLLTFIPGFYHTRIAYYTWRGYKGFSWDQIPAS